MFNNSLMLSLFGSFLFNLKEVLIFSIVLVVVGVIGYFLIKSSAFRKFFLAFLCFLIFLGGFASGVLLNKYYNTSGGIIGKLSQVLNPNYVEVENRDEIVFNFKSIMLIQTDGDKYRAEFSTDDVIELASNEAYAVFVNDSPCELIEYGKDYVSDEISSDYVISDFYYAFFDEDLNFVLKDTLKFRFAFYKNSTKLVVETVGGSDAVALWNSYFQKNDFVVKIKPMENLYISSYSTIDIVYKDVELGFDEKISSIKIKNGSTYVLPDSSDLDVQGSRFLGLSFDNENIISDKSLIVSEDLTLYVHYAELHTAIFTTRTTTGNRFHFITEYCLGDRLGDIISDEPTSAGMLFLGWSLDGKTILSEDERIYVYDDEYLLFVPIWESDSYLIPVLLNGGTMTYDGYTYNSDFTITAKSDEVIVLNEPISDNLIFDCYNARIYLNDGRYVPISCGDKTFNVSILDLIEQYNDSIIVDEEDTIVITNVKSVEIKAFYSANTSNPELLSDYYLIDYIEFESGYFGVSLEMSASCEDCVRMIYAQCWKNDWQTASLPEMMLVITDFFNFDIEFDSETTARDFLEDVYRIIWLEQHQ